MSESFAAGGELNRLLRENRRIGRRCAPTFTAGINPRPSTSRCRGVQVAYVPLQQLIALALGAAASAILAPMTDGDWSG